VEETHGFTVLNFQVVVALVGLGASRFGYALASGTIGVYEATKRKWQIKVGMLESLLCSFWGVGCWVRLVQMLFSYCPFLGHGMAF
jgi:hypothetical protein